MQKMELSIKHLSEWGYLKQLLYFYFFSINYVALYLRLQKSVSNSELQKACLTCSLISVSSRWLNTTVSLNYNVPSQMLPGLRQVHYLQNGTLKPA